MTLSRIYIFAVLWYNSTTTISVINNGLGDSIIFSFTANECVTNNMIVLLVDDHEYGDSNHTLLKQFPIEFDGIKKIMQRAEIVLFKQMRLNQGDYHILYFPYTCCISDLNLDDGQLLEIIERKTLADYAASFKSKDGKNRDDNMYKMINIRNQYPSCKLSYLIEGKVSKLGTRHQGISMMNIQASLYTKQREHGFLVTYTADMYDTVNKLKQLCEWYSVNLGKKTLLPLIQDTYSEILEKSKPSDEEVMSTRVTRIWKSIDGVGVQSAHYLSSNFTLYQLLRGEINYADFDTLKQQGARFTGSVDKGKNGPANIVEFSQSDELQKKLYKVITQLGDDKSRVLATQTTPLEVAEFISGTNNNVHTLKTSKGQTVIGSTTRKKWHTILSWSKPKLC